MNIMTSEYWEIDELCREENIISNIFCVIYYDDFEPDHVTIVFP
jgi:hypothetical protein